jgi:hypothetical protein
MRLTQPEQKERTVMYVLFVLMGRKEGFEYHAQACTAGGAINESLIPSQRINYSLGCVILYKIELFFRPMYFCSNGTHELRAPHLKSRRAGIRLSKHPRGPRPS